MLAPVLSEESLCDSIVDKEYTLLLDVLCLAQCEYVLVEGAVVDLGMASGGLLQKQRRTCLVPGSPSQSYYLVESERRTAATWYQQWRNSKLGDAKVTPCSMDYFSFDLFCHYFFTL